MRGIIGHVTDKTMFIILFCAITNVFRLKVKGEKNR